MALSADGKTALTGSADKTVRLWNAATAAPLGLPLQHQGKVTTVALSADGRTALTGSDDKTARLMDTATGKQLGAPLPHQGRVSAVILSIDGKTALTGSDDGTGRFWEAATGKPIGSPLQHYDSVTAVALSADAKTTLTGSADKMARVWKVPQSIDSDPERVILWSQLITDWKWTIWPWSAFSMQPPGTNDALVWRSSAARRTKRSRLSAVPPQLSLSNADCHHRRTRRFAEQFRDPACVHS